MGFGLRFGLAGLFEGHHLEEGRTLIRIWRAGGASEGPESWGRREKGVGNEALLYHCRDELLLIS